jgi:hypothetical protein
MEEDSALHQCLAGPLLEGQGRCQVGHMLLGQLGWPLLLP